MPVVVRGFRRALPSVRDELGRFGVATIHEARGQRGLLDPAIRPITAGERAVGTALTVSVPPNDNWMVHVAVEECHEGDILVIAPTGPSDAGYIGELIATALLFRGVRAAVIDAGCRDVAELRTMGFTAWSRSVSARGTVKATLGDVNVPVVCGGQAIAPGDVIVADDDGVVVVPRVDASAVAEAAAAREEREAASRTRYAAGELSLDVYAMRDALAGAGLRYVEGGVDEGDPAREGTA